MKRTFLYILLFAMPLFLQAQQPEWFPVGGKWHYSYHYLFADGSGYAKAMISDTAIVNGQFCKQITWEYKSPNQFPGGASACEGMGAGNYVYEDSNRVYFYNQVLNQFLLLYDFTAQVGDTWSIPTVMKANSINLDTMIIKVDSTDTTTINGHQLKVMYLTQINESSITVFNSRKITEYIGSTTSFFPWGRGACEGPFASPLRCYNDSLIRYYKFPSNPSCKNISTFIKQQDKNELPHLEIAPHPVKEVSIIQLKISNSRQLQDVNCTIYGPLGRKVGEFFPTSSSPGQVSFKLNATTWNAGIYFYNIRSEKNTTLKTGKFVVQ